MTNLSLTEPTGTIVALTPSAVRQVRYLLKKQNREEGYLRLGVRGGGCSGLSYVMAIEDAPGPKDVTYEVEGLTVIVDRKSARFLSGSTLDYSLRHLMEGGWVWTNPNAGRSCGCGTSFAPK